MGIHRFPLLIAEAVAVVVAEGNVLARQIHIDDGLGDLIDHRFRAGHRDGVIVQDLIFLIYDKVLAQFAHIADVHGNFLLDFPFYLDGNGAGITAFFLKCACRHIAGIGNAVSEMGGSGLVNLGQIHHNRNVGGVDLVEVRAVAGQFQSDSGNVFCNIHQAVAFQHRLTLEHYGNIVESGFGVGADYGDDIQPKHNGDGSRQQNGKYFIFCHCCQSPFPSSAVSAAALQPGLLPSALPWGTAHFAAAVPKSGLPGAA